MPNGKKPLLRDQISDLREHFIALNEQSKSQNEKLDKIIVKQERHECESNKYREQQATNTEAIKNINEDKLPMMRKLIFAGYALAGSAFLTGLGALLKWAYTIFFKN